MVAVRFDAVGADWTKSLSYEKFVWPSMDFKTLKLTVKAVAGMMMGLQILILYIIFRMLHLSSEDITLSLLRHKYSHIVSFNRLNSRASNSHPH